MPFKRATYLFLTILRILQMLSYSPVIKSHVLDKHLITNFKNFTSKCFELVDKVVSRTVSKNISLFNLTLCYTDSAYHKQERLC